MENKKFELPNGSKIIVSTSDDVKSGTAIIGHTYETVGLSDCFDYQEKFIKDLANGE